MAKGSDGGSSSAGWTNGTTDATGGRPAPQLSDKVGQSPSVKSAGKGQ